MFKGCNSGNNIHVYIAYLEKEIYIYIYLRFLESSEKLFSLISILFCTICLQYVVKNHSTSNFCYLSDNKIGMSRTVMV